MKRLLTEPCAWRPKELAEYTDWLVDFPEPAQEEIFTLSQQRKPLTAGLELTAPPQPSKSLQTLVKRTMRALRAGRGFVVLRKLVDGKLAQDDAVRAFRIFCGLIGKALPQNRAEDLYVMVQDEGGLRGSKTRQGLPFHTDSANGFIDSRPSVFGLYAVRAARSGGTSLLASAYTVHNLLSVHHPAALERLYRHFYFDRTADLRDGDSPTTTSPVFFARGDDVVMRYNRFYIERGYETAQISLSPEDKYALDCVEGILSGEEIVFQLDLCDGDILFVNNTRILHSRTAYTDDPASKRCFVRVWLEDHVHI